MQFLSFYTGHKAAVLSLAGHAKEPLFYSAGADGLIVRWSVHDPDQGDVLTRINGIMPSITFDKTSNSLFAALNQKGVVRINCTSGKNELVVPIPSTSFTKIEHLENWLVVITKIGELIVIDTNIWKIVHRITIGPDKVSSFTLAGGKFWSYGLQGIGKIGFEQNNFSKIDEANFSDQAFITAIGSRILLVYNSKLNVVDMKRPAKILLDNVYEERRVMKLMGGLNAPGAIALLEDGDMQVIKWNKKEVFVESTVQNKHYGTLNDLLWSENHKFVVTAGKDKNIGIWRFN